MHIVLRSDTIVDIRDNGVQVVHWKRFYLTIKLYHMSRVNLRGRKDFVVYTLPLCQGNTVVGINDTCLSKRDAYNTIVGLPPNSLNFIAEVADAINDDPNYHSTISNHLPNKARNVTMYTQCEVNFYLDQTADASGLTSEWNLRTLNADVDAVLLLKANPTDSDSPLLFKSDKATRHQQRSGRITIHNNEFNRCCSVTGSKGKHKLMSTPKRRQICY
jgi:hypothetical protein